MGIRAKARKAPQATPLAGSSSPGRVPCVQCHRRSIPSTIGNQSLGQWLQAKENELQWRDFALHDEYRDSKGKVIKFTLTNDPYQIRNVLEIIMQDNGFKGAEKFIKEFNNTNELEAELISSGWHLVDDMLTRKRALQLLREELRVLDFERTEYLEKFLAKAKEEIKKLLDRSKAEIEGERERLGLVSHTTSIQNKEGDTNTYTSWQMSANDSTADLAAAARDVLAKQKAVADRQKILEIAKGLIIRPNQNELLIPAKEKLARAHADLYLTQQEHVARHPILAAFTDESKSTKLQLIARGNPRVVAQVLGEETGKKLDAISMVRSNIDNWRFLLKHPFIVEETKKALAPTELEERWIDDKAAETGDVSQLETAFVAFAAILGGLLAAFPTAGGSLAVTGTILATGASALSAGRSIQKYTLEKATTNTALDRANAIAKDDPSFFWLAVELCGALLDVGQAAAAFAKIVKAARAARDAKAIEKAVRESIHDRGLGRELEDKLVEKLTHDVELARIKGVEHIAMKNMVYEAGDLRFSTRNLKDQMVTLSSGVGDDGIIMEAARDIKLRPHEQTLLSHANGWEFEAGDELMRPSDLEWFVANSKYDNIRIVACNMGNEKLHPLLNGLAKKYRKKIISYRGKVSVGASGDVLEAGLPAMEIVFDGKGLAKKGPLPEVNISKGHPVAGSKRVLSAVSQEAVDVRQRLISLRQAGIRLDPRLREEVEAIRRLAEHDVSAAKKRLEALEGFLEETRLRERGDSLQLQKAMDSSEPKVDLEPEVGKEDILTEFEPSHEKSSFTTYDDRLKQTPVDKVYWEGGRRGEGIAKPWDKRLADNLKKRYDVDGIQYHNAHADFTPVVTRDGRGILNQLEIEKITFDRDANFEKAYEAFAERWKVTPKQAEKIIEKRNWTIHEVEDGKTIQLIDSDIHKSFPHYGGVIEDAHRQGLRMKDIPEIDKNKLKKPKP